MKTTRSIYATNPVYSTIHKLMENQMASSMSLEDILSRPADSFEKPKPLPVGTYLCTVGSPYKFGESKVQKTPYVEFPVIINSAGPDVDMEALSTVGGVADKKLRPITFYLTEDATYRIREFFDHLGLEHAGKPIKETLPETAGRPFYATIKHTTSEDGKSTYANIAGTAAV